jgi:hypothetical protein
MKYTVWGGHDYPNELILVEGETAPTWDCPDMRLRAVIDADTWAAAYKQYQHFLEELT